MVENDRIDRERLIKELGLIDISDEARHEAFEAIYNVKPRGVSLGETDNAVVLEFESLLRSLGIGYRKTQEPDY